MRQVLNFLITGLLIWLCSLVFPGIVAIAGLIPLLIANIIFFGITGIALALCILFLLPGMYRNAPIRPLLVIALILSSIVGALILHFVCPLVSGFAFANFGLALAVSVASTLIMCGISLIRRG